MTTPSIPPRRLVQNFHLVWLDENIDQTNNDCHSSITQLRQIINTVHTFTDVDECIDFITDIAETTFMLISPAFYQTITATVQDIPQVSRVYIIAENNSSHEKQANESSKVAGVYTDITSICQALKQATQNCDHNSVSLSFVKKSDATADQSLDALPCSFMYTQILKEILLTIDFDQGHINEFLTYCRQQFADNHNSLREIDKIEEEYRHQQPIWWYTYSSYLYSMLNRALRTMEFDLIVKMSFFICDLHNQITTLHAEQYDGQKQSNLFTVYRGQGLSYTDFDQIKKTQGGLLAFNNFLSTSLDRAVSMVFAESNTSDSDLISVLFEINIDPSILSSSFANIKNASYYRQEEEILFSMHSVFRIGEMKQIEDNDRLWEVQLTLTADNDPQLEALTKIMHAETEGSTGWLRLGKLMWKVGQFGKAEEVFNMLLDESTDEREKEELRDQLALIKDDYGKYTEALSHYQQIIKIGLKPLLPDHSHLSTFYNNIGKTSQNVCEYSTEFSSLEQALEIFHKAIPVNDPYLATSSNNLGELYSSKGDYSKALSYFEQALEIQQKILPADHPDIVTSYNNMALVYHEIGKHSRSLFYYEQALQIEQKTLPSNHPQLATSYNNIALVYEKMGRYSQALSYCEKALQIQQRILPPNHPDLATSFNNMGEMYYNTDDYSKALFSFEQALEIQEKTLLPNHLDKSISYRNLAKVYGKMGDYSKALWAAERGLDILQVSLPPTHPELAIVKKYIELIKQLL